MLGYEEQDMIGSRVDLVTHPDDWIKELGIIESILAKAVKSATLEKRIFKKTGEVLLVRSHLSLFDDGNSQNFIVSSIEKIPYTEIQHSDNRKPDEGVYKELLDSFDGAAAIIDINGIILGANQVVSARHKRPVNELIGMDAATLFPPSHNETRRQIIEQVISTATAVRFEEDVDGIILQNVIYPVFDSYRQVKKLAIYSIDATETNRFQKELNLKNFALEESFNAVVLADPKGKVTYVNKAFLQLWRFKDSSQAIGKMGSGLFESPSEIEKLIALVHDTGHWEGELNAVLGDGSQAIVHVLGKLLVDQENKPVGLMATCVDITNQRKSEKALKDTGRRLALIFNSSEDAQALWRVDPGNRLICEIANTKYLDSMTYLSGGQSPIVEQDIRDILNAIGLTTQIIDHYLSYYSQTILSGKGVRFDSSLFINNQTVYFEISLSPLVDSSGRCTHILMNSRDITARRLTEISLKESEERLRLALQSANQGIFDLDIPTGEARVSEEYVTMLGYDPISFRETNTFWKERLHPDDREKVLTTYEDYVHKRIVDYRVEFRQQTKSGEWKWILSVGKIVSFDELGNPVRMIGTHTDITHLKTVEVALKESEHRLNTVIKNAPIILFTVNIDGNITLSIGKALELLGIQPNEHVGMSFYELYKDVPDAITFVQKAIQGNTSRHTVKFGSLHFDTFYMPLYGEKGDIAGAMTLVLDITEKIKADQVSEKKNRELQNIIDALDNSALVSITDKKGVILKVNKRFCTLAGYKEEELIGRNHQIINSGYHNSFFWENFWRTISKGDVWRGEIMNRAKDGTEYWVDTAVNPIFNEVGDITHYLSIRQDITELKKSRQKIEDNEERLRQAVAVSKIGIFDHDHLSGTIHWSVELLEINGLSHEVTPTLEKYFSNIHPDDRNMVAKAVKHAHDPSGSGLFDVTHRILLPNGEIRWLKMRSQTQFVGEGKGRVPTRTVGAVEDITDRVKSQQLLEQSEFKFRSLFQFSPVGIALNDLDTGAFLDFNDALIKPTGYTRTEFMNLTYWDVTPRQYEAEENTHLKSLRETGYYGPYEKEYIRKDGRHYPVLLTGVRITDKLGRNVIWSVVQDISDRKVYEDLLLKSNLRLAQIEHFVDLTTDGILVSTEAGQVVYLNQVSAKRLAIPRDDCQNYNVWDIEALFHNEVEWQKHVLDLKVVGSNTLEGLSRNRSEGTIIQVEQTVRYVTLQGKGYIIAVTRDITERKRNETELRESQKRLYDAQRIAKLGYWEYDLLTNKIWWSEEQREINGLTNLESPLTQEEFINLLHPEDRDSFLRNIRQALSTQSDSEAIYRIIRPGGEVRTIHGKAQVSCDSEGRAVKLTGVNQDITERVLADKALKESEQALRKAQAAAKIGSWRTDTISGKRQWSDEVFKIFALEGGKPLSFDEFLFYVHPEDKEYVIKTLKYAMAKPGRTYDLIHRIIVHNSVKWIREQAEFSFDEFSNLSGGFGIIQDITDQKNVQEANLIFNQSHILTNTGSWRASFKTGELFWSDSTYALHGLDKETIHLTPDVFFNSIYFEDRDRIKSANREFLLSKDSFETEYRVETKPGKIKWLSIKGKILNDENGRPLEMYGIVRDISLEKRNLEALETARKTAEDAASVKDAFLSIMSHEIRTPLNSVIGLSNLLLRRNPREDQLEVVKTLKSSADNLMHLVNDILDFNRIRSGKVQFELLEFNLNEFLQQQYNFSKTITQDKGLDLIFQIDPQVPKLIEGDVTRLHQIFTNLLANAIKFTHHGFVKLTAELVSRKDNDLLISFKIEDSGIGISPDKQDVIFEPFHQSDREISRKYGGTGLGLSIVRSLVNLMKGSLDLTSELGKGSIFTVVIPFQVAKQNLSDIEVTVGSVNKPRRRTRTKALTVLYVEDVESNRFLIENLLTDNRIECTTVTSGRVAIRLTTVKKFDLILMDIQMPGMDGYETTDKIRSQKKGKNRKTPVIAFTAEPYSSSLKDKTLKHDIQYLMSKPFDPDYLIEKITLYAFPKKAASNLFSYLFYEEAFNHDLKKLHKIHKAVIADIMRFENGLKKNEKGKDINGIRREIHRIRPIIKNLACTSLVSIFDTYRLHESYNDEVKTLVGKTRRIVRKLLSELKKVAY